MYYYNGKNEILNLKIDGEIDNLYYIIKNGQKKFYSKDLFYNDINKLRMNLVKNEIIFSGRTLTKEELLKHLDEIFDYNYIIENFIYIEDNFLSCFKTKDFKTYGYGLHKYRVIFHDVLFQSFHTLHPENTTEQKFKKNLFMILKIAETFVDEKTLKLVYRKPNIADYIKLYELEKINMPKYYKKYELSVDNFTEHTIDENLSLF